MAKKTVKTVTTTVSTPSKKRKASKRKKAKTTKKTRRKSPDKLTKSITENLVELQKVHTNLAEKFDNLSNQISSLLQLFESAARSFAEHPAIKSAEKDKEFLDKIDKLLDQNKTIAKGLTLMEGKIKERMYGNPTSQNNQQMNRSLGDTESFSQPSSGRPLPRF